MTEEITDALYEELAELMKCESAEIGSGLLFEVDIASIATAKEAKGLLEQVHADSDEHHVILTRWAELATSIEELGEIRFLHTNPGGRSRLRAYVETRMVMLCKTREHVRKVACDVRLGSVAWSALARKGLQILQKEESAKPPT